MFERKADAEAWEVKARAGAVQEVKVDQGERRTTFREYAERWRLSRQIGQALEYQRHIESRLRHHLYPHFGDRQIQAVTLTDVLEWVAKLLQGGVAQSSVKTYFDLLNAIMNAAMVDKVVTDNPCKAVRLSAILRGFSRAPKWVPTTDDVLSLVEVVPDREAKIRCDLCRNCARGSCWSVSAAQRCYWWS
ncbi:phage integrase central domain-containing protein [Micromonospora olivasterospora]|uniref:phage integrase central domain-containing protein n=1 Tax=Micromonospora olivasterospora TaxID=1880 RepID=UPI003CD08789